MKVFTGSAPFDLHLSITVTLAIMRGDRPSRPAHPAFTDKLWELMQHCWSQELEPRPDISSVLQVLQNPLALISFYNKTFANLIVRSESPQFSAHGASGAEIPKGDDEGAGRSVYLGPALDFMALQQLHHLSGSSPEFHDRFSNVLYDEGFKRWVPNLQGGDLLWLVDYLDKVCRRLSPLAP